MKKDIIMTMPSYFRDDMNIMGYRFGKAISISHSSHRILWHTRANCAEGQKTAAPFGAAADIRFS